MKQFEENGQEISAGHTLQLNIEGAPYKWDLQYITGLEIRELGRIAPELEIYLAIRKPWEDELVKNEDRIDLAREGIEHFYAKGGIHGLVMIQINDKPFEIHRGKHPVSEIKRIGEVPPAYELEELIEGKLTPLDDNGHVIIKGREQFFGHPKDGSSS